MVLCGCMVWHHDIVKPLIITIDIVAEAAMVTHSSSPYKIEEETASEGEN